MQVVRMILIGSVISVLALMNNGVMANDRFVQSHVGYQALSLDISFTLANDAVESERFVNGFDADFLVAHQIAGGYTMGIKYLDLNVADELHEEIDHSQLWIGLQLSF